MGAVSGPMGPSAHPKPLSAHENENSKEPQSSSLGVQETGGILGWVDGLCRSVMTGVPLHTHACMWAEQGGGELS